MEYILVGIGGVFGSIARYSLGRIISSRSKTSFPLGTFMINITGAFLLGIVYSINSKSSYLLLGDGFLGAYTTFSTFMFESLGLFEDREYINAVIYIFISVILGFIGFYFGTVLYRFAFL